MRFQKVGRSLCGDAVAHLIRVHISVMLCVFSISCETMVMKMIKVLCRVILVVAVLTSGAASSQTLTGPQKNAVRSANNYLNMTGFSRQGLIAQLSSEYGEGYSVGDATAAVDSLSLDWNKQAVRSASQYLEMTGFSCSGLIEQLSSDYGSKYSTSQATYGAQQAGAC